MTTNTPHRVIAVTYPDGQILDVVGPLEVFSRTARLLRDQNVTQNLAYEVEITAAEQGPVRMSSGLDLIATRAYRYIRQIDTLIVAGGIGTMTARDDPDLIRWIQRQHQRGNIQRIASVCTGALILGQAGLLDGLRVTTHWDYCDELARCCPTCEVDPDAVRVGEEQNAPTASGAAAHPNDTDALRFVDHRPGGKLLLEPKRARQNPDDLDVAPEIPETLLHDSLNRLLSALAGLDELLQKCKVLLGRSVDPRKSLCLVVGRVLRQERRKYQR